MVFVRLLDGSSKVAPPHVLSVDTLLRWLADECGYALSPRFLNALWITRNARPLSSATATASSASLAPSDTVALRLRLPGAGKFYFYYSAMNAGKTTTLLQSSFNYNERGMNTLLFTPLVDNRHGVGKITSRIGLHADAVAFDAHFDFLQHILPIRSQYSCILVDEAQFLTKDQVLQLAHVVDQTKLPVLAYGLRQDFRGEPFEGSKYLLAWADELIEIKTICHCGRKATFNARVDQNGNMVEVGEQIVIGGNECYVSVCRKHFYERRPHKIIEQGDSMMKRCDSGFVEQ